jgi:hypothetical protein
MPIVSCPYSQGSELLDSGLRCLPPSAHDRAPPTTNGAYVEATTQATSLAIDDPKVWSPWF